MMKFKLTKKLSGALLVLAALHVVASPKPNIVVILADDYGYGSAT